MLDRALNALALRIAGRSKDYEFPLVRGKRDVGFFIALDVFRHFLSQEFLGIAVFFRQRDDRNTDAIALGGDRLHALKDVFHLIMLPCRAQDRLAGNVVTFFVIREHE